MQQCLVWAEPAGSNGMRAAPSSPSLHCHFHYFSFFLAIRHPAPAFWLKESVDAAHTAPGLLASCSCPASLI